MATELARLFSPLRIGRREVKNRIAFQAHRNNFGFTVDTDSGLRYIAYQEARARGGVGFIVTEDVPFHVASEYHDSGIPANQLVVDRYRRLADAVHKHGATVVSQVVHMGREHDQDTAMPLWGFSALPSFLTGGVPHEMTVSEIRQVIDAYAMRAETIKEAGLDGVELHATHATLPQQSISPFANLRNDEYGGDSQRRMRFCLELVTALRDALGPEPILGIRVSGDDWVEGGLGNAGIIEVCKVLVATGKLDYISVSAGAMKHHYAIVMGSTYVPPGVLVPYAAAIKEAIPGIPVFTTDRIKDPAEAEAILEKGQADMIGMTRALISDPDLPNKAQAGDLQSIRECTSCRQGCIERSGIRKRVICTQNAEVGYEYLGGLKPATVKKRVLVVGGGPAGLEAARVAAERGHEVVLCEASDDIGGQIRLAVKAPTREEFDAIIRYRRHELARLKVDIRLNTRVDAQLARSLHPDAIVLATGAVPYKPPIPGIDLPHVLTAWEALTGEKPIGERVVQIDLQGEHEALSVADYLLEQGKQVTLVTPLLMIGQPINPAQQHFMQDRLLGRGMKFVPNTVVQAIESSCLKVCLANAPGDKWTIEGVDTVVLTTGYRANDGLRNELAGIAAELHFCGDCAAPRRALQAVPDGYRIGALL